MRALPKPIMMGLWAIFGAVMCALSVATFLFFGIWSILALVSGALAPIGLP